AVADAKDRNSEGGQPGVQPRGPRSAHRIGPPREDEPPRRGGGDFVGREVAGHQLAVDGKVADPPCDELGGLAAVIDDQVLLLFRRSMAHVRPSSGRPVRPTILPRSRSNPSRIAGPFPIPPFKARSACRTRRIAGTPARAGNRRMSLSVFSMIG